MKDPINPSLFLSHVSYFNDSLNQLQFGDIWFYIYLYLSISYNDNYRLLPFLFEPILALLYYESSMKDTIRISDLEVEIFSMLIYFLFDCF